MLKKYAIAILCLISAGLTLSPAVYATDAGVAYEEARETDLSEGGFQKYIKEAAPEIKADLCIEQDAEEADMEEAVAPEYSSSGPVLIPISCPTFGYAPIDEYEAGDVFTADAALDSSMGGYALAGVPEIPQVPMTVNRNVAAFINYFQTRGRGHFERWLERSESYMSMLRAILKENGLPEDLSYIALIESGLNPKAKSRANAVGMWQFIKGTGKKYGLRVDWWIDERMDPEKATKAAARYFKDLYGQFGSWYLAAAGYNAGEGRILRAVKKHGTEDFWELASYRKPLKRETKEYVPKYLAAMLIAKDPVIYGFDEQDFSRPIAYDKVLIQQATDIRVIADAAGTTVDEIIRLNPELLRWFTPPNYPDYAVKIPFGAREAFEQNFSKLPATERISFLTHKVKRGDTLSKIAKQYGTSVDPILFLNNIKGKKRLRAGTVIMVPVRAEKALKNKGTVAEVIPYKGPQG